MPEKETAKMFVTGLKPDLFPEEFYSRNCEMLQEAMDESRAELSSYLDILEITDRINKADVKKEKRDPPFFHTVVDTKASGESDLVYVKKPGSKCPEAKPKDRKGTFKVRKVEESVLDKAVDELKSICQIRIRFSGSFHQILDKSLWESKI